MTYCHQIIDYMQELIYIQQDSRENIQDGETTIYKLYDSYSYNQKNFFNVLVIYGNKAVTNVKFTEETDTIEEIKDYILENNKNNLCYEQGVYKSNVDEYINSEDILDTFNTISISYYTDKTKSTNSNIEDIELLENTYKTHTEPIEYEYKTAYLEDFEFYSAYNPDTLYKNEEINFILNLFEFLKPYQTIIITIIPISFILLLILVIFLINSIGCEKDSNEIKTNYFDRIPIELLIGVYFLIFCFSAAILNYIFNIDYININEKIYLVAIVYIMNIVSLEILAITSIIRLKSKTLLDTALSGRFIKWGINTSKKIIIKFLNIFKSLINIIRNIKNDLMKDMNLTLKLVLYIGGYLLISIILVMIFGPVGFAIDLGIFFYVIYEISFVLKSFKKLEKSLEQTYNGDIVKLKKEDFHKEFQKIIKYINDMTNGLENAVKESLKSERMKTELITNVSHDIKTPLTSIINYVDLLKKENIENEKAKEYIEILEGKSQRLKKLTEDLVEVSKASSGNVKINFEKIGVNEILNQAIGEYKDKFEEKNLEIITNLQKNSVKIMADSKYLYRVIDNLFGNIYKYALENSRVYIETEDANEKIKIIFKNISKEKLNITEEELMQRFVRGDKARTTEGSGLGLAIAKSLTNLQKGNLICKIDGDLFKVEIEFEKI